VLANDTDADGDPLTAVLASGPSHGALQLNADGSFAYTPASGFSGQDSFAYKANDGAADSNIATVTITVEFKVYMPNILSLESPILGQGRENWARRLRHTS
jgi:VCBS repeat-containing protein